MQQGGLIWPTNSGFTWPSNQSQISTTNGSTSGLQWPTQNQATSSQIQLPSHTTSLSSYPNPDRHSVELIATALKEGTLSTKEDQKMLEEVRHVIKTNSREIIEMRKKIDEAVNQFWEKSNAINTTYAEMAESIAKQLVRRESVPQKDAENLLFLMNCAKSVAELYFTSAKQYMELHALNSQGKFNDYKEVINLIFYARSKELDLFKSRLDILHNQANHELQIMTAMQNQELKVEAQKFDQLLKALELVANEDQRKFDNSISAEKQKHEEEKDWAKLLLEQEKAKSEQEFNRIKEKNECAIKELQIKSTEGIEKLRIEETTKVEKAKISAEARCKIVQSVASAASTTASSIAQPCLVS